VQELLLDGLPEFRVGTTTKPALQRNEFPVQQPLQVPFAPWLVALVAIGGTESGRFQGHTIPVVEQVELADVCIDFSLLARCPAAVRRHPETVDPCRADQGQRLGVRPVANCPVQPTHRLFDTGVKVASTLLPGRKVGLTSDGVDDGLPALPALVAPGRPGHHGNDLVLAKPVVARQLTVVDRVQPHPARTQRVDAQSGDAYRLAVFLGGIRGGLHRDEQAEPYGYVTVGLRVGARPRSDRRRTTGSRDRLLDLW
jgi:hypothetical protein